MPPKKGVKKERTKPDSYCTLLEEIYNNSKVHKIVDSILDSKNCMGSMFTSRRPMVFIVPKPYLSKKVDAEKIKQHMIRGPLVSKYDKDTERKTYSGEHEKWGMRVISDVTSNSLKVDGEKSEIVITHPNGSVVALCANELPPMKKAGGRMYGGALLNLSNGQELTRGKALREMIVNDYKHMFPPGQYGFRDINCWTNWCYSSLVLHLNDNLPNFRDVFLPFLGTSPMSALELMLQYHIISDDKQTGGGSGDNYFINDDILRAFADSSQYYLNPDTNILKNARDLILRLQTSIGNNPGLLLESPYYMNDIIDNHKSMLLAQLGKDGVKNIGNVLVGVYKKVYGTLDESNPDQYNLYKKVYDKTYIVKLGMDLMRFNSGMVHNYPESDAFLSVVHGGTLPAVVKTLTGTSEIGSEYSAEFRGGSSKLFEQFNQEAFWKKFINHVAFLYTMGRDYPGSNPYERSPLFFNTIPSNDLNSLLGFGIESIGERAHPERGVISEVVFQSDPLKVDKPMTAFGI